MYFFKKLRYLNDTRFYKYTFLAFLNSFLLLCLVILFIHLGSLIFIVAFNSSRIRGFVSTHLPDPTGINLTWRGRVSLEASDIVVCWPCVASPLTRPLHVQYLSVSCLKTNRKMCTEKSLYSGRVEGRNKKQNCLNE